MADFLRWASLYSVASVHPSSAGGIIECARGGKEGEENCERSELTREERGKRGGGGDYLLKKVIEVRKERGRKMVETYIY